MKLTPELEFVEAVAEEVDGTSAVTLFTTSNSSVFVSSSLLIKAKG
jgi:hypothetical protein